jgi:hypothetical protein
MNASTWFLVAFAFDLSALGLCFTSLAKCVKI